MPATSTAPPPAKVSTSAGVAQLLTQYRDVIARLLARTGTSPDQLRAWVANAMRSTPSLWRCDPETVLGAALRCAQFNLAPNDGQNLAWIIPYGTSAAFQLGYGGVIELARRAVPGLLIDGAAVYPGDLFYVDAGREPPLRYVPAAARKTPQPRGGEARAWWVRARYPDGRTHVHVLDRDGVEYHRSFSKYPGGDAWTKSYDAMALKSVVLDMRRWLPSSPFLAAALSSEDEVVRLDDLDDDGEPRALSAPVDPDQLTLDEEAT